MYITINKLSLDGFDVLLKYPEGDRGCKVVKIVDWLYGTGLIVV